MFFFHKKVFFFRKGFYLCTAKPKGSTRGVAQLVAYNVRDVGVASSSLATPTKCKKPLSKRAVFLFVIPQNICYNNKVWKR